MLLISLARCVHEPDQLLPLLRSVSLATFYLAAECSGVLDLRDGGQVSERGGQPPEQGLLRRGLPRGVLRRRLPLDHGGGAAAG